ncbi:MAG: tetratricopeptide repeat protein [Candidatus Zixiibacteriota bacterium]|nr:MAG: tetratricopeptide repeat protein [candidate division Zixibacteria bacterium]
MKKAKFKIGLIFLILLFAVGLNPTYGATGVLLKIRVEEGISGDSASFRLIDQREIRLENGVQTASFLANFTLSTTPTVLADGNIMLDLNLVTLPPRPQTVFTGVLADDKEEFLLGEVEVKEGRSFKIFLTPRITDLPEPDCLLDTRDKEAEDWDELPGSHFFFRYILNSLADLHWSHIKGHGEGEYRRFRGVFGFTQPAMDRMEYFLLPCRANEIVWDHRFDIGLDPVKNKVYVVYNLFERSIDSPGVGFLLFYRLWGYAPPMLAEGIGNYFSLSHHFTRKIIASGRRVPLRKLTVTRDYRKQPEDVAFWESSSFVRYLVRTYNVDRFRRLYKKATDLTLEQAIEEVYQKDLAALEKEWLSFLEGQRDTIADLYYGAEMKMKNRHYNEAIELYQDMLNLYGRDVGILRSLAYVYYLSGDYDSSEKLYLEVLSRDTLNLEYLQTLGNIRGLKGDYGKARSYYQKVISLDSTFIDSYIELAQLEMSQGDLRLAKGYFEQAEGLRPIAQAEIEIYSGLGSIHDELGETEQAKKILERALLSAKHFVHEFPDKPIPYLKLGESFFNVGKIDSAVNFLEISEFMEDRPVYRGRILLALGKAYKRRGEISRARRSLQEVLGLPCGHKEKKEAERFLKSM